MDGQVERYLAQLTNACLEACINLGADTKTALKLVRRASMFLYDLPALYEAREQNKLDELLQSWAAAEAAKPEQLEAPTA